MGSFDFLFQLDEKWKFTRKLCQAISHVESDFDASKVGFLASKTKIVLAISKNFNMSNLRLNGSRSALTKLLMRNVIA